MSNDENNSAISSVEYKKVTEELYKRNLELARLNKEVESLNEDLKNVIKQRESLVHLVTHKVKGSFTRTKYIFAEIHKFADVLRDEKRLYPLRWV